MLKRIPTKGANTELKNGKFLSGILDFKIANIKSIKLEGFPPGRAGDPSHFHVDGHEVSSSHMRTEFKQGRVEVGSRHLLERERRGRAGAAGGGEGT